MKRRNFIAGGVALSGLLAYSAKRGVRIPPLLWEPQSLPSEFTYPLNYALTDANKSAQFKIKTQGLIQQAQSPSKSDSNNEGSTNDPNKPRLRAFTPEPTLQLSVAQPQRVHLSINNISPRAKLVIESESVIPVTEETEGITRHLTIDLKPNTTITAHWQLDVAGGYTFAAIGDTGGQQELGWCLRRAHDLGALFMLHLGDFHYTEGDYDNAIELFNTAPLPCYVAIGNHDFHDDQTLYQLFLDNIGPFNASFTLGGARFSNIDTASNFLPYGAGQRGALLRELADQTSVSRGPINDEKPNHIAFTHRPLFDPQANSTHDIGSIGERDWLINALKACQAHTLLSGHIHIYAREDIQGIDNIIVGQGLGHQDLITNQDYSKIALGSVDENGGVSFDFPNMAMPWEMHCHPRSDVVKQSLSEAPHAKRIQALTQGCSLGQSK